MVKNTSDYKSFMMHKSIVIIKKHNTTFLRNVLMTLGKSIYPLNPTLLIKSALFECMIKNTSNEISFIFLIIWFQL